MRVVGLTVFAVISGLLLDTINSQPEPYKKALPVLGDVMMDENGNVLIYYTDGSRNASWDSICADYGKPDDIAMIICRQLGYQGGSAINTIDLQSEKAFSSSGFVHGFECGENPTYSHILQCSLIAHTCENQPLKVSCSSDWLWQDPFDGQVYLCPPRDFPTGNLSASTGLVSIYLKEWRGISQLNSTYPLGSHEADSICRQLGYTGAVANSAKRWNTTNDNYSHCYSHDDPVYVPDINRAAWFTTDNPGLNCGGSSQDCIGCCFQYLSSHCTNCANTSDVVVTCTYDIALLRGKLVTGWSDRDTTCSFSGKSLPHSACAQQDIPLRTFEIVVGSVGSVLVLLLIVVITVAIIQRCRLWLARRRRGDRQLVEHDEN